MDVGELLVCLVPEETRLDLVRVYLKAKSQTHPSLVQIGNPVERRELDLE